MLICRTPFRISFFGGGTDYPGWYHENGGSVLATTINKYCYISCRYLPPFFEHKLRIVYSLIENCQSVDEIKHPSVRETLRHAGCERGLEIHHDGDLPARSGMGSSSSFTVGLLHALYALEGRMASKRDLALESIHIEQDLIKETVGSQDQVSAAYGGFNHIEFAKSGRISVNPVTIGAGRIAELNSHLMLFYTKIRRTASDIAQSYVKHIRSSGERLQRMQEMVAKGLDILNGPGDIGDFGKLLHQSWQLKRKLSTAVSNDYVDSYYRKALEAGALGGKITGAGGGGFLMIFARPEDQDRVREVLSNLIYVPFQFETSGSRIIFYDPDCEDFVSLENARTYGDACTFREISSIIGEEPLR